MKKKLGRRTAAAASKCVCSGTLSEYPISHHFIELVIMNSSRHHSLVHSTPLLFFRYVSIYNQTLYHHHVCSTAAFVTRPDVGSLVCCTYFTYIILYAYYKIIIIIYAAHCDTIYYYNTGSTRVRNNII